MSLSIQRLRFENYQNYVIISSRITAYDSELRPVNFKGYVIISSRFVLDKKTNSELIDF